MNKRIFSLLLALVLLLACVPCRVNAAELSESEQIIQFEDGSCIIVTISEMSARASGTKTASKSYTYKDTDGTARWKITLTASFTYNGTSATCTASSCTVTVYADNWYEVSKTAGKSGNTATASVTMGRTFLGITIAKDTYELSLSCDKDGNLS